MVNKKTCVYDKVTRYQFFQNIVGEVALKLMVDSPLTKIEENAILKELNAKTKKE